MERQKHERKEARTGNMGLASCGVKCLNSSAVFHINFSAGLTVLFSEIPHERQAQKRCVQCYKRQDGATKKHIDSQNIFGKAQKGASLTLNGL